MLSFWSTFQNNLNYASTSNILEVIKIYNLGDKTFKTDFNLGQGVSQKVDFFLIFELILQGNFKNKTFALSNKKSIFFLFLAFCLLNFTILSKYYLKGCCFTKKAS